MVNIVFLILFPLLPATVLAFIKHNVVSAWIVRISILIIAFASLFLAYSYFHRERQYFITQGNIIKYIFMSAEVLLSFIITLYSIKYKKVLPVLLTITQTMLMLFFEFNEEHLTNPPSNHMFIDKLSIIMALIIAIVGGLICIFAIDYMRDYHHHHKEYTDRRKLFFSILFLFLSAMFGIIFSNDLLWMFFFWEVTTFCSFIFIGYTKTDEAIKNSFTALNLNLIGGLAFAIAIVILGYKFNIIEFSTLLDSKLSANELIVPLLLLAIAGLTKSAQLPFSKWLLGAMVAPTPTSALLHSSTMVKAGVYLVIRISPLICGNIVGNMVVYIGGLTFVLASMIAISQSDAKKVLAYSTIANLGLVISCAGIGTYESLWAGILLIVFHAVSKSLMFLSVGSTEILLGSRDIEDMHGLIVKLPEMAFLMAVGIAGMFLAPFGMLISKWAALKAFIDSKNLIIVLFLVFGSSATLFYWTKWLGKLTAVLHKSEKVKNDMKVDQWISLLIHAFLIICLCLAFPQISKYMIEPYLHNLYPETQMVIISQGNQFIMSIMLSMIVVVPFGIRFLTSSFEEKITTVYMSGVNAGDSKHFIDSFGNQKRMYLSSWYMDKTFGEKKLLNIGIILCLAIIIGVSIIVIGGAI